MNKEHLRFITPILITISLAILGVIWNSVTDIGKTVNDLRERMAKVETVIKYKLAKENP